LAFVRVLCVQWLADECFTRDELRAICVDALGVWPNPVELQRSYPPGR
jgi:hypothetical protein